MIGTLWTNRSKRDVVRAAVLLVYFAVLPGCALEPVARVLVGASNLAEMPAQINSFSVDPQQIDLLVGCGGGGGPPVGPSSGVTKARWNVVGKRIRLALDGATVHQQSTPEIRDTISGEFDVELDLSSIGVIRLVAYNAVDQRVTQETMVNIRVYAPTSCEPPCTPGVDC